MFKSCTEILKTIYLYISCPVPFILNLAILCSDFRLVNDQNTAAGPQSAKIAIYHSVVGNGETITENLFVV